MYVTYRTYTKHISNTCKYIYKPIKQVLLQTHIKPIENEQGYAHLWNLYVQLMHTYTVKTTKQQTT